MQYPLRHNYLKKYQLFSIEKKGLLKKDACCFKKRHYE